MSKLAFDFKGSLKVDGVLISAEKQLEIELDGQLITGGCVDAAIARSIGVKNIVTALDLDEVLSHYSISDFIEHIICNNSISDSDVEQISKLLADSLK